MAYYAEEKKLRLLYEEVERFFNERMTKYENAYFQARKARREFWSSMEKIAEVTEYISRAATEIVKRKKEMRPAPPPASAMSSAWEAAYLDYEALRNAPIVAGSNPLEVQVKRQRAKELFTNHKKSMQKAWREERDFRKRLKVTSGEHQRIVDNAARAVATDEWLRKL